MNIFYLDNCPDRSAKAMTNTHVIKMIVESAQILSTAHRVLDGKEVIRISKSGSKLKKWDHDTLDHVLYKSTHVNHPSSIWARESIENYRWLYKHFVSLCNEYTRRYDKVHATEKLLLDVLSNPPVSIPQVKGTKIRLAIADVSWHVKNDEIQSYRNYYVGEKLKTKTDLKRFNKILNTFYA